jgi:hypothetical protein
VISGIIAGRTGGLVAQAATRNTPAVNDRARSFTGRGACSEHLSPSVDGFLNDMIRALCVEDLHKSQLLGAVFALIA